MSVEAMGFETPAGDSVCSVGLEIRFANGTKVSVQFWRLIARGKPVVSVFDHRQKCGLPEPIDAFGVLRSNVVGKRVSQAVMSKTTGDLRLAFEGDVELEVFNFTAFEIGEIVFPDGSTEYSNYALAD